MEDLELLVYFFDFDIDEFKVEGFAFSNKGDEVDLVEVIINKILKEDNDICDSISDNELDKLLEDVSNNLGDIPIHEWIDVDK